MNNIIEEGKRVHEKIKRAHMEAKQQAWETKLAAMRADPRNWVIGLGAVKWDEQQQYDLLMSK